MNENLKTRKIGPGETITDVYHPQNHMILRYCHPVEVGKKRQIFCIFKARFLVKLLHLKYLGMKNEKLQIIHEWIRDHVNSNENDEAKREKIEQKLMAYANEKFNTKINNMYMEKVKEIKFKTGPK